MEKNIEELTLLLMYLTSWDEESFYYDEFDNLNKSVLKNSWKGYSFDTINNLTDNGYLFFSKHKNKSVTLTPKGEELAKKNNRKIFEQRIISLIKFTLCRTKIKTVSSVY